MTGDDAERTLLQRIVQGYRRVGERLERMDDLGSGALPDCMDRTRAVARWERSRPPRSAEGPEG